jgi:hypothetical protein
MHASEGTGRLFVESRRAPSLTPATVPAYEEWGGVVLGVLPSRVVGARLGLRLYAFDGAGTVIG